MTDAAPSLHYECGRKDMRLVDGSTFFVLVALALESAIRESAGKTEDRLLKGILYSAAETKRQAVLFAEVVVDLGVERADALSELPPILILVLNTPSRIPYRDQSNKLDRDRIHTLKENNVV